jgi:hypothetical protein
MPLPDYSFLPAPLWLITVLHIVTLTLHFVAMNFMLGGLIFILFGKLSNRWNDPTIKRLVKLLPSFMAATVTLGVAPLLFVQLVYYQQIYSASIVSGWFWIMIFVVVIVSYYFLYGAAFSERGRPVFLALALLGLLYVSVVYSSVFSMAERPELIHSLYESNQSGLVVNPELGIWIFRWLHMIAGAITVGAFFAGILGRNNMGVFILSKRFYLWGMVGAMILGVVYMLTLGDYLRPFMRSPAIWLVLVSAILSLGSLHFFFKQRLVPAGIMLSVSLVSMVVIRHLLRLILLEGKFDPASIPVNPQWSVFVIFLVFFLIAIGLVWYMIRLLLTGPKQPVR